ncbi:MAG: ATP-binding protein [Crenarchaeota archaeon]|nr:ATP-binding protein [Thermoproteota archaeon]
MIDLALAAFAASVLAVSMLRNGGNCEILIGRSGITPCVLNFNRHLCVYGPTRSGKTSFIRYLARKLARKYIVTILDWHGEYLDIENIVNVEYNLVHIDVSKIPLKLLVEVLGHGLGLNEPSMYLLYRILKNSKVEDIADIVKAVEEYFVTTRTEAEMKAAILRRLEYVLSNMRMGIIEPDMLVSESCCIDLSGLTVIEEKKLASSLILAILYVYYMSNGVVCRDPRHFIIIEEAQNLLDSNSILYHIILELAKYGVRVILVTNTLPDSSILAHCNIIVFKLRPELMKNMVMSDEIRELMINLKDGEAILLTPSTIRRFVPFKDKAPVNKALRRKITSVEESPTESRQVSEKDLGRSGFSVNSDYTLKRSDDSPVNVVKTVSKSNHAVTVQDRSPVQSVDLDRYLKKVDDVEKKLALIRERLDEIERMLAYEDEILRKIVSNIS